MRLIAVIIAALRAYEAVLCANMLQIMSIVAANSVCYSIELCAIRVPHNG